VPRRGYAIPLTEHFQSEITLLHVVLSVDDLSSEASYLARGAKEKARRQLDDFLCTGLNHLRVRESV